MTEESKERIVVPSEDGEDQYFQELIRFELDQLNRTYIVLIPEEQVDMEEAEIFPVRIEDETEDGKFKLYPIESDDEWELVEETLNTLLDEEIV